MREGVCFAMLSQRTYSPSSYIRLVINIFISLFIVVLALPSNSSAAQNIYRVPLNLAAVQKVKLQISFGGEASGLPTWTRVGTSVPSNVWQCDAFLREGDKIFVGGFELKKAKDYSSISDLSYFFDSRECTVFVKNVRDPNLDNKAYFLVKNFKFYDAMNYTNKEKFDIIGFEKIAMVYSHKLWKGYSVKTHASYINNYEQPNPLVLQNVALDAITRGSIVCLDVEQWLTKGNKAEVAESVEAFVKLTDAFQGKLRGVPVGYYSMFPARDYHRAVKGKDSPAYKEWQNENDALLRIAGKVDIIFPSIYTFYTDKVGWVRYAVAQLKESHKYGKPVKSFLWPQFHESNKVLGGIYLDTSYWTLELLTAMRLSDGLIIWSPSAEKYLDYSSEWWQATVAIMIGLRQ